MATVVAAALVLGLVPRVAAAASKRSVVAAFYPVAYAAQRVGGDRVDVTNLTPAGAEPHDLELNPDQIDKVLDADLVVDLGQRKVVVTGHEAFGYLAARYGLRQEGVAGLSPDAEPDAKRLGQLSDVVKRLGVTVVFTEALVYVSVMDDNLVKLRSALGCS